MEPLRAYKAEFTKWRMFAATTVSFSIKSPSPAKETSSAAKAARRRVRIGENGGREPKDRSAFAFRSGLTTSSRAKSGFAVDGTTVELSPANGRILEPSHESLGQD